MIYGLHPIAEALEAGRDFDKIFVRRAQTNAETKNIVSLAKERGIPVLFVPTEKLDRLTRKNHQGTVAFLSIVDYMPLEEVITTAFEEGRFPFIVLLDGLTDVRNFGAIARSAEAVGADAIVIPERGSVSVTSDAVKTSAGALSRITVCRVNNIPSAIRLMQQSGIHVVAASEKGELQYTEAKLTPPIGIVLGAEDVGPSTDTLRLVDEIAMIPLKGQIGSLNVSVAAGIFLYESIRQTDQLT